MTKSRSIWVGVLLCALSPWSLASTQPTFPVGGNQITGCGARLTCRAPDPCGVQCCPKDYPYLNNCDCTCHRDPVEATKHCSNLTECH